MYAYKITNAANGKGYIGITIEPVVRRFRRHLSMSRKGSPFALHRAIRKYGSDRFSVETLADVASWQELCAIERVLIVEHGTHARSECGYNQTEGGDGSYGYRHTPETKQKMAAAWLRPDRLLQHRAVHLGMKHTPETRAKISAKCGHFKNRGCVHSKEQHAALAAINMGNTYHLGKKHSPETLVKMKEISRSPERREISRLANLGHKHSDETRKKIRMARAKQAPRTEESKRRTSESLRLSWLRRRRFVENGDARQAS